MSVVAFLGARRGIPEKLSDQDAQRQYRNTGERRVCPIVVQPHVHAYGKYSAERFGAYGLCSEENRASLALILIGVVDSTAEHTLAAEKKQCLVEIVADRDADPSGSWI